jgi:hypothetical protein
MFECEKDMFECCVSSFVLLAACAGAVGRNFLGAQRLLPVFAVARLRICQACSKGLLSNLDFEFSV